MALFIEDYQRHCVDGEMDDSRLQFENRMKILSLLVIQQTCRDADRELYVASLFHVAVDLLKTTIIQDYQQFTFETIQNDCDDDDEDQWDVENASYFADLVLYFIVVLKTISPLLPIQHTHILKTYYSNFIRSWSIIIYCFEFPECHGVIGLNFAVQCSIRVRWYPRPLR